MELERDRQIVQNLQRYYKVTTPFISSNAYTKNKWFSNSGEVERQLRAEAATIAAQTSAQLNAEFRTPEYDISKRRSSQTKLRRQLMLQDKSVLKKLRKKSDDVNMPHVHWLTTSRTSSEFGVFYPKFRF